MCRILILLIVAGIVSMVASSIRVVDLTHTHGESAIYWPGNPQYNFTILFRNRTQGGYWYESNSFATAEHGGTHLDSPSHFAEGGWRTQQIPMDKLFGPGVIINVKSKVLTDPDYRVTVRDLQDWENIYGRIPKKAFVLMNSGWSDHYPNKSLVFGTPTTDDPATFHFPGWHEDAVTWLINNRVINIVGVDTPSNDYGQSKTFPTHVILGKANVPGVENVAYLDRIPPNGTMIYAAAMKLQNGSGGPVRVFATITEQENGETSGSFITRSSFYTIVFLIMATIV